MASSAVTFGAPLRRARLDLTIAILAVLLVLVCLIAVCVGAVPIAAGDVWRVVQARATGGVSGLDIATEQIVWKFRLPRVLLAALCGAGLAVAGAVLQTVVNNALADPYVLGLSSGASFGAVLVIVLGSGVAGGLSTAGAAFLGALLTTAIVLALGQQRGVLSPTRVVLAGVAVGYLMFAGTGFLQLQARPDQLRQVMFWMLGSVGGATWDSVRLVALVAIPCIAALLPFGRTLNALTAGDAESMSMGINVRLVRPLLLAAAALLTGVLIAACGGIGFVGLMIPHTVRLLFGHDHRRTLVLSALIGACYLVLVDLLSRTVDAPNEMPIGILTAAFGAPFFLWLLRRDRTIVAAS